MVEEGEETLLMPSVGERVHCSTSVLLGIPSTLQILCALERNGLTLVLRGTSYICACFLKVGKRRLVKRLNGYCLSIRVKFEEIP